MEGLGVAPSLIKVHPQIPFFCLVEHTSLSFSANHLEVKRKNAIFANSSQTMLKPKGKATGEDMI